MNPFGFSTWLAAGGIRGGTTYGDMEGPLARVPSV